MEENKQEGRPLAVEAKPQQRFGGGFRTEWVTGTTSDPDGNPVGFTLDGGAGLGNPFLTLTVKFTDGHAVTENIDVRDLLTAWTNSIVADRA